ncbi:protein ALTERED PHOSPHATE STARVATION RESPONSE 1-like [Phragmites australis]|uniref:protein ALTERED PHOSPHATE STARVATION RESPONSE 1-like n=1 Tax=Phragmites australis TaxID=29695 RepID=UPI002D76556E|nr:protein ALTERED PHOSPHATE STARVATION RESPONSE 1-like [Phragmites australis]
MGCGQSKLPHGAEDSAAVALCRDRSALVADAISRRYALAEAHRAYAVSLRATGAALHGFLRAVQDAAPPPGPGAAHCLPAQRKEDGADALPPAALVSPLPAAAVPDAKQVDDDDGGHIHFHSDEDESSDEDQSPDDCGSHIRFSYDEETEPPLLPTEPLLPAAPAQPQPPQMATPYGSGYAPPHSYGPGPGLAYGYGGGYGAEMGGYGQSFFSTNARSQPPPYGQSFFSMNYALSQPQPPSLSYDHRPQVTNATVHYYQRDGATGPQLPTSHGGYPYQFPQGGGLPPMATSSGHGQPSTPLPPPSPPRVSTWDFLNPFESFESYYQEQPVGPAIHTPNQSWNDVGEEEDIPELEDEEWEEVVKEVYGNECTFVNGELAKEEGRKSSAGEELHRKSKSSDSSSSTLREALHRKSKSSDGSSSTGSSMVHVVERSVVEEQLKHSGDAKPPAVGVVEEQLKHSGDAEPPAVTGKMYNDDVEVVQEIKLQFDRASKLAGDMRKVLEVGKMPYNQKNSGLKVPSLMICGLPAMDEEFLQFEEEKAMECGNLSSTLQKLYMWEKRLLEEVKAEEKIRVLYDQKHKELKKLDERGAEAHKLEAIDINIRKLSTKISIAIQVVNTTSKKINKLRDEELWPQTRELIQGFMQMWHTMSECHQIQCHALSQAKNIDSTITAARFSEAHIDLIKQLELQLLDITASFAAWFNAQKSYVSTLNEWLKKGIEYVPEVTDDGVPPFSPGRLGAPPIFIICNNWAISMGRISEKEVADTMQAFASDVLRLWERHMSEWRQGVLANKDTDRDLRSMEREDELSMHKALDTQNKKLVLVSDQSGVSLSAQEDGPPTEAGLQSCMSKVFEAMESFAAACTNAYKDLHLRTEEEDSTT